MTESSITRCGLVAIVGRPNVGKSTLLNALVGERLSIVTPRPHTTRHRILGVVTRPAGQILYLDTPGMHRQAKRAMNRSINRAVHAAVAEADLAVQVVEAGRWDDEDQGVYAALAEREIPRLLALNKLDRVREKSALLPFAEQMCARHVFDEVFWLSAQRSEGIADLEKGILERLPEREPAFDPDTFTDRSERFLCAELIREQLMRQLGEELPYATTVEIESFKDREDGLAEIIAVIWVEREGQKAIVIGAGGERLKKIGSAARRGIEKLLDRRAFLRLWVKVRAGWSDDEAALKRFGYE
ncbi:MAG TPA: GTPase Era [Rhodanobacteraceae bacterium]|nr:GTPase Era [Rhodanobacteraceae bacterium]